MGQGSRGGNSGLTSSGNRQRDDKALRDAKKDAKTVGKKTPGGGRSEGSRGGSSGSKSRGSSGRGLRGVRGVRGLRGLGRLAKDLKKAGTSSGSGSSGSKASSKSVRPQAIHPQNKIPNITRVNAPKTKLSKQRINKTPN